MSALVSDERWLRGVLAADVGQVTRADEVPHLLNAVSGLVRCDVLLTHLDEHPIMSGRHGSVVSPSDVLDPYQLRRAPRPA